MWWCDPGPASPACRINVAGRDGLCEWNRLNESNYRAGGANASGRRALLQANCSASHMGRVGRIIGTVLLAGQNINSQRISTGRAWHFKRYSKSPTLAALETSARANGLGLWNTPTPVARGPSGNGNDPQTAPYSLAI